MTLDNILSVGRNNDGEFDFAVKATIYNLSYESMKEFRSTLVTAIGIAEDMWRRSQNEESAKTLDSIVKNIPK